jgi:hypothetical protein
MTWLRNLVFGAFISAIATRIVNDYRCLDCGACLVTGPCGLRCLRGCLQLARPRDADR